MRVMHLWSLNERVVQVLQGRWQAASLVHSQPVRIVIMFIVTKSMPEQRSELNHGQTAWQEVFDRCNRRQLRHHHLAAFCSGIESQHDCIKFLPFSSQECWLHTL